MNSYILLTIDKMLEWELEKCFGKEKLDVTRLEIIQSELPIRVCLQTIATRWRRRSTCLHEEGNRLEWGKSC
ncbi:MAG: hypothetical protein Q4D62_05120 [Planctomycetia bacterium]|nr:hypothetical protein [Planctomycetia bacterium]